MRINKLHTICTMTLAMILFVGFEASASNWEMEAGAGCMDEACMFGGQTVAQNSGVAQLHKINVFSIDGKDPREAQDRAAEAVRAMMPIALVETKNAVDVEGGQSGRTRATAFLVSPCLALTNHHAVYGKTVNPDPNADHSVILKLGAGTEGGFKYAISATPVRSGRSTKDGSDWALLKLDKCAGRKLGWMAIQIPNEKAVNNLSVSMAGYPTDRSAAQLSYQKNCSLKKFEQLNSSFDHDCASRTGSSGSPIFVMRNGKPVVVAMHYGSGSDKDGVLKTYSDQDANGAVPLNFLKENPEIMNLIKADIESFPAENPATAPAQSSESNHTA